MIKPLAPIAAASFFLLALGKALAEKKDTAESGIKLLKIKKIRHKNVHRNY